MDAATKAKFQQAALQQDMHLYTSTGTSLQHRLLEEKKLLLVLASNIMKKALCPDDVLSNRNKQHASPLLDEAFTELKTELNEHLENGRTACLTADVWNLNQLDSQDLIPPNREPAQTCRHNVDVCA
jgi:hypothetical protein